MIIAFAVFPLVTERACVCDGHGSLIIIHRNRGNLLIRVNCLPCADN